MKRIVVKLSPPSPPKPKPHKAGSFHLVIGTKPGGLWSVVRGGGDDVIVTNRKERT